MNTLSSLPRNAYTSRQSREGVAQFSRFDIAEWEAKLTWLWQPQRVIETQKKTDDTGLVWVAELSPDLMVCVGVDSRGVHLCALLQGSDGLIWDYSHGFCEVQSFSMDSPGDAQKFADQMKPLLHRNCFLAGAAVECTAEERNQWVQWMVGRAARE